MANRHVVRLFDETTTADRVVLGGKGRGLADMVALGLPVPPGFVIITGVSRALRSVGRFPKRLDWHLRRGIKSLEQKTGKRFGDPEKPLLVSVRSGAPVSMPGMMDTILNLGITADIRESMSRQFGDTFAHDCRGRYMATIGPSNYTDQTPWEQLEMAIMAVCRSWDSPRAVSYRNAHNIPDWYGTAVNVQEMVFGNKDPQSCSGVVFSVNVTTGQPGLYGEFLVQAQGEDVVAGTHTGRPISEMRQWNPAVYDQLEELVMRLQAYYGHVVDVEFTVQSGKLYLLQVRGAKLAPLATVTHAVHNVWAKRLTKLDALSCVTREELTGLQTAGFDEESVTNHEHRIMARGLPVSAGAVVGRAAFSKEAAIQMSRDGNGPVILIRPDTSPDDLDGMLASKAIVTGVGGATSHAAVVARGMGITAVVGCGAMYIFNGYVNGSRLQELRMNGHCIQQGSIISVDGLRGLVFIGSVAANAVTDIKEVNILRRWAKSLKPELLLTLPAIAWATMHGRHNMSVHMNNFYLTDAMAASAAGSVLAQSATTLRINVHREVAELMACYLTLAVCGEVRHIYDAGRQYGELQTQFGTRFGFTRDEAFPDGRDDRTFAQQFVTRHLQALPVSSIADFLELAEEAFAKLTWNESYGGAKWAAIAKAAKDFLRGTTNHTVFVDHAFDLQHNGGALFNKHQMVEATSDRRLRKALTEKKFVTGVSQLRSALIACMYNFLSVSENLPTEAPLSAEVTSLYNEGILLVVWKACDDKTSNISPQGRGR